MRQSSSHSRSAASGGAYAQPRRNGRKRIKKSTVYLCITIFAALMLLTVAVVQRSVSDKRAYNTYMELAEQSCFTGDYDSALTSLRKAANIDATDECLLKMVDCYEAQNNFDKALEILRRMDIGNITVSSKISDLTQKREGLLAADYITIGGRQFSAKATSLVLDGLGLTDDVLPEVLQLYAVDSLSAANNSLSDISPLSGLGGLVTLNLSDNAIENLSPLSGLTGLRTLYLDNNPIKDLSPLYMLTNLTTLSIKDISITQKQLAELSAALPNCAIHSETASVDIPDISLGGLTFKADQTELDLSFMGIHDISALSGCKRLTRINLRGNDVSELCSLMNIPGLQWLDIAVNSVSDLRPLMGVSTLTSICASENQITSTVALGSITGLKELYLDNNPINDFSGLRKLKKLETLSLSGTGAEDDDLKALYNLSSLRLLNLENNPALTGEGINMLKKEIPACTITHSELTYTIDIGGNKVKSDITELSLTGLGIDDIDGLGSLSLLERVNLSNNNIINLFVFGYAQSRMTITYLNLSGNLISDVTSLMTLTALEQLDLSYNRLDTVIPLASMTWLRELNLTGNPLTVEQVDELRSELVNCNIIFN